MSSTGQHAARKVPSGFAIGIDVGGTKIAGGLVDLAKGSVAHPRRVPSRTERSGMAVLADVKALLAELVDAARDEGVPLVGAGVGVAELVDARGGVFSGYRIAWNGIDVQGLLSEVIETRVEADVRAAALAEAIHGAGRPFRHFLYLSVGTGISTTLVQDGKPYPGSRGAALVLANGPTTFHCPACGTDSRYILEDFASGPALAARYAEATGASGLDAEEVLRRAEAGDAMARSVVESAATALGSAVGLLVNSLDPEAIVIGGGLGSAPGRYREVLAASVRAHLWQDDVRTMPVLTAELGTNAGIVGAAATMALRKREESRFRPAPPQARGAAASN
ncbi:MAG: ROK family protein [Rhizobiales bacterium]|nr:ROK family protein [Hyphomicrobiales bacterium]